MAKSSQIIGYIIGSIMACTQPTSAQQPPKDRKDYVIDALEMQRNQLSSGLAICEGTFNDITGQLRKQVGDLTKQVTDLTAENDKLKKPAPTPDVAPTPK